MTEDIVINIPDLHLLYFLGLASTAVVLPESGSETEEEGNSLGTEKSMQETNLV